MKKKFIFRTKHFIIISGCVFVTSMIFLFNAWLKTHDLVVQSRFLVKVHRNGMILVDTARLHSLERGYEKYMSMERARQKAIYDSCIKVIDECYKHEISMSISNNQEHSRIR